MIRVMIVDDSATARDVLTAIIEEDPNMEVVGVAEHGSDAVRKAKKLSPDIISMDVHMPIMDGLEATAKIMAECPVPILIVSTDDSSKTAYRALENGALAIVDKGRLVDIDDANSGEEYRSKLRVLSRAPFAAARPVLKKVAMPGALSGLLENRVILIASSTGGPKALSSIICALPAELPSAVVIAQHLSEGFVEGLADWLNESSAITVKVAENSEKMAHGVVYLPPTGNHIEVTGSGRIILDPSPPINNLRPNCDRLLMSGARNYGRRAIGVVLTGMGEDGANGLLEMRKSGGFCIAQDETTSIVYGMPAVAARIGAADKIAAVTDIAGIIVDRLMEK